MQTSPTDKELAKEIARLAKENALLRDLVSVLRELPGNKDREIPAAKEHAAQTSKEAEAKTPRKTKSDRKSRTLPGGPGVEPPPSA